MFAFMMVQKFRVESRKRSLQGKVVVITGASSGLGEALAHYFYKSGCKVILASRRIDELERVKRDMLSHKKIPFAYPPTVLQLDLEQLNGIAEFIANVLSMYNHIDLLVNNGGISVRADVLSSSMDVDMKVMKINYFGAVALTKSVLPSMVKKRSGLICFISSVQGKFSLPHRSSYSASKHALQAFADSLRAEVAHKGIRVVCISPGYIRTQLSVNALTKCGGTYGKMDKTTVEGMDPHRLACEIVSAILRNDKDSMICGLQAKIAYYLRFFLPNVYFWLMEKRAMSLTT